MRICRITADRDVAQIPGGTVPVHACALVRHPKVRVKRSTLARSRPYVVVKDLGLKNGTRLPTLSRGIKPPILRRCLALRLECLVVSPACLIRRRVCGTVLDPAALQPRFRAHHIFINPPFARSPPEDHIRTSLIVAQHAIGI
jgi:hypothetical protein